MEIEDLKREWTGFTFDTAQFEVLPEDMVQFARACGETEPRFTDPDHPDFQAPPTYPTRYNGRRVLPEDFPRLGNGFGFDAGKTVYPKAPIRAGDVLVGRSQVHDVYEKTGRSGKMVFIVHRMEFQNQDGELVSVVDWRMMQRAGGPPRGEGQA